MITFTIDKTEYRSPNFSERPAGTAPDMLVLHSGEGTKQSDLATLCNNKVVMSKRVSAHYYVDRAGAVYELVDPIRVAWHAGTSSWQGRDSASIQAHSIGVETEHKQGQTWPVVQRQALSWLFRSLIARYHIPKSFVVAHRWIAPTRKSDPTDWNDVALKEWIAALYRPLVSGAGIYRARVACPIFEAPRGGAPIALGGLAAVAMGELVTITDTNNEFGHLDTQVGFLPMGALEPL